MIKNPAGLLKKFNGKKILVVGDVMIDRYIWGNVSRISPEAPVPVVAVEREDMMLGGAANVAANIASLGGHAILAGVVGSDEGARLLAGRLESFGIDASGLIALPDRPTTLKTRIVAHSQHVVRFDHEVKAPVDGGARNRLLHFIEETMRNVDAVIVSDYAKGVIGRSLMNRITQNADGRFIAVDPKVSNLECYRHVSVITPNRLEASTASRIDIHDEESLLAAAEWFFARLECECILITRGPEGMTLVKPGRNVYHIPAVARKVYDVTGAGDTVIATMTICRAAGAAIEDSARIANVAAGIVVGEVGTSVIRKDDLLTQLHKAVNSTS